MPVDTKTIAKNTMFLYVRMFIILICNLFVVRIVLNALGIEDFGINNVVGGIVMMCSFLTSTMNAASQRFFSFELGRKNFKSLSEYFLTTLWGYLGLSILILLIAETIGLWFVQNKLNVPQHRLSAALWVYQTSIVAFILNVISIPYNSIFIAREKMNFYAYMGLLEMVLKILTAYMLFMYFGDRLKLYAVLLCIAMSIPSFCYIIVGSLKFAECRIKKYWNKKIFKEIFSYSCWNLFGAVSAVLRSQGVNVLLNMFFGPVVNASRAIAYQVSSATNHFVINFFKAVQPQIIKTYAADERSQMLDLVYTSSKICFYLLFIIALPVFCGAPFILKAWLDMVPQQAVYFTRLVIILSLIESTIYPLQTALMSTGNIKWYQVVTGGFLLLNLPISWLCLSCGCSAASTFYVSILLAIIAQISRIIFMKKMLLMPINIFIKKTVLPILFVVGLGMTISLGVNKYMHISNFIDFGGMIISTTISILLIIWSVGLSRTEKKYLKNFVVRRMKK